MSESELSFGIFTTDVNLIVQSWDSWLERATTIAATQAQGQTLDSLLPESRRRLLARFRRVIDEGTTEILAPAFHKYLFACPLSVTSQYFDHMQQRITIAPLRADENIVGCIVTIEDVTSRLEQERQLAAALNDPDEQKRLLATRSITDRTQFETTDHLVDRLNDESWRVRKYAIEGLVRHGKEEAITSLLNSLRHEHRNPSVLNSALQVLALSGIDTIAPLIELLHSSDPDLRGYIALALGEQPDQRAIPALIAALSDVDVNVRFHAIEALGKLRATVAVDALIDIAESRDFYLAFPALDALKSIGESRIAWKLVPLLEDELLCLPAADALGHLGDEEVVEPLARLLNKPNTPIEIITKALAVIYDRYETLYREARHIADLARGVIEASGVQNLLGAIEQSGSGNLRTMVLVLGWLEGPLVERALTRLLGNPTARKEIVDALVRYGSRVVDLLIEQLGAKDLETRHAAILALGRIGHTRSVPALVKRLFLEEEFLILLAGALAKIGDRQAFEPLLTLIGHPDAAVRQAIIAALNSLGHPEMPKRALKLMNDSDPLVRESAVKIVGYFGYPECVDQLLEHCHDESEIVRRAAIEHIPFVEDDRVVGILADAIKRDKPRVRAAAAHAFAHMDAADAYPYLCAALDDSDAWVRYFAVRSIGRQEYRDLLPRLAVLATKDTANQVRIAAMDVLGQIGSERAISILTSLLDASEPDLSLAAMAALGRIKHPDALPPLLALLRDPDANRRLASLRALTERSGSGVEESLQWIAVVDTDNRVAQQAIDALVKMATPISIKALINLTAEATRREAAIDALARLDNSKFELVADGLNYPQTSVRQAIIEVLTRLKHTRASELLANALDDAEATIRLTALKALAHLGNISAERKIAVLARTDPDVDVRRAAQKIVRVS